jgi:hypothetical protein
LKLAGDFGNHLGRVLELVVDIVGQQDLAGAHEATDQDDRHDGQGHGQFDQAVTGLFFGNFVCYRLHEISPLSDWC